MKMTRITFHRIIVCIPFLVHASSNGAPDQRPRYAVGQENFVKHRNFSHVGLNNSPTSTQIIEVPSAMLQTLKFKSNLFFNNFFNVYTTKAKALAEKLHHAVNQVHAIEYDLDELIENLEDQYSKEENESRKSVFSKLLTQTTLKRLEIRNKVAVEYGILQCVYVLGRSCVVDADCHGQGCILQCRRSWALWWQTSTCR
ncbi:hypothetical protein MAR_000550 [Mya arenaria]|uniref:Uncharacterized protein n=1 Tax=Mya arenaria TaxID=6604 RepID=A0ABY7F948_MYAAR|nr:uncharacterized protein LOC128209908 [Mya arenaria]WAR18712.1 hypothetical protein MAR_000550 [Mya arenaria]